MKKFAVAAALLTAIVATPAMAAEGMPQDYSRGRQIECLSLAIYWEARGQSAPAQMAVANVVLNRTRSARFPDDVCAVVFQRNGGRCQFSWACTRARHQRPADVDAWTRARRVAATALDGAADMTGGALFFHAVHVAPGWTGLRRTVVVGGHAFYAPAGGKARNG